MIMSHYFYDLTHFRGLSSNTKKKSSLFGSNENFKICFRDLLTFRELCLALPKAQSIIDYCYGIMQFLHLIDSIQNCLSFNWQYQFRQTDRIVITFPFLILVGKEILLKEAQRQLLYYENQTRACLKVRHQLVYMGKSF